MTIQGFRFRPATVQVSVGAKLRFANRDDVRHTATADGGGFDTGTLRKGSARTITLRRAGTFSYHCDFHRFMTGKVVVR